MKKNILRQYADMKTEIREIESRIKKLTDKLDKINTDGNCEYTVTGGAGGLQRYKIDGFPAAEYDETSYLLSKNIRLLKERKAKVNEMLISVEQYINMIDDSAIRRIIVYKYIDGFSWVQTAQKMGRAYTEEGCRKLCERYMRKN